MLQGVEEVIVDVSPEVSSRFPGLRVLAVRIRGLEIRTSNERVEQLKKEVYKRIRSRYSLETLKDENKIRAYRDFYWRIGIDPTKLRPSSEALIRRVLLGKEIPTINTLVDSYNLASMETAITMAAYDASKIGSDLKLRFAKKGEEFLGIGMEKPMKLRGMEPVIEDGEKLIAVYPYRDAEESKTTLETKNCVLMICGVPSIAYESLAEAKEIALRYISTCCGISS